MAKTLILRLPRKRQMYKVSRRKMRVATISSGFVKRAERRERFIFSIYMFALNGLTKKIRVFLRAVGF